MRERYPKVAVKPIPCWWAATITFGNVNCGMRRLPVGTFCLLIAR